MHSGTTHALRNPVGDAAISALAVDEPFVYIGTETDGNGLPHRRDRPAQLAVLDVRTRRVVHTEEFAGAIAVRRASLDVGLARLAALVDKAPIVFDARARRLLSPPAPLPEATAFAMAAPGDGRAYYVHDAEIIAIDLRDGTWSRVLSASGPVLQLAVDNRGTIAFSVGTELFRAQLPLTLGIRSGG